MSSIFETAAIVVVGVQAHHTICDAAITAIESADVVFGGLRHRTIIDQQNIAYRQWYDWQSPLEVSLHCIAEAVGQNLKTVVVASGDPMHFGMGVTIRKKIPDVSLVSFPAPSSFSLAANVLGWSMQDCDCTSVHHAPVTTLMPKLTGARRLLCLTKNATTPHEVASLLCELGFPHTVLHILNDLGSDQQQVSQLTAEQCLRDKPTFSDLHVLAIEARQPDSSASLSLFCEDDQLIHDGQLTKFSFRAVTLAALRPRPQAWLWDIGAGSGSMSIGWNRLGGQAIAVEKNPQRITHIKENSRNILGYYLKTLHSEAQSALPSLQKISPTAPDALFFGGALDTIEHYMPYLSNQGVLVANAVTLDSQAHLIALQHKYGGTLRRLQAEEFLPIATHAALHPLRSVLQYQWVRQS